MKKVKEIPADKYLNKIMEIKRNNYIVQVFVESLTKNLYECKIQKILSNECPFKVGENLSITIAELKYYRIVGA